MKYLIPIIVSVLFISCNNPSSKSLMTKLTPEEINTLSKKDTLFKDFYEKLVVVRDSVLVSEVEKSEYVELTYGDYLNLSDFYGDTIYWKKMDKGIEERWESEFQPIEKEIDSVVDFYVKRYEKNNLNNYLKIELDRVKTDYYSYTSGVKDVSLGFKLTPLKGTVQQVVFYYSIEPKIDEDKEDPLFGNLLKDLNGCRSTTPFSRPVVRYWNVGYDWKDVLSGSSKNEVLRDYNIEIEIDRIRVNDTNLHKKDSELPYDIEQYIKYKESDIMVSYYEESISKEYLNKRFVSLWDFKFKVQDSIINTNEKFKKIREIEKKYFDRDLN